MSVKAHFYLQLAYQRKLSLSQPWSSIIPLLWDAGRALVQYFLELPGNRYLFAERSSRHHLFVAAHGMDVIARACLLLENNLQRQQDGWESMRIAHNKKPYLTPPKKKLLFRIHKLHRQLVLDCVRAQVVSKRCYLSDLEAYSEQQFANTCSGFSVQCTIIYHLCWLYGRTDTHSENRVVTDKGG